MKKLRSQERELRATIQQMETQLDVQAVAADSGREERQKLKRLNAKLESLRDTNRELGKKEKRLEKRAEQETRTQQDLAQKEKKLQKKVSELKAKVSKLQKKLAPLEEGKERTLTARSVRESDKGTFWVIVKWDRLYLIQEPVGSLGTFRRNTDDVRIGKAKSFTVIEPKKNRGTALRGNWKKSQDVQSMLDAIPSELASLQFAVFPDSYDTFIGLRDFFRDKGYAWNWVPLRKMDQKLVLGSSDKTTVQ